MSAIKPKVSQPFYKIWGPAQKPVKVSSLSTRSMSLQPFMGGAEINEVNPGLDRNPTDDTSNLEGKFNSGVNRTDLPSQWGYPNVKRKIGGTQMLLADEIRSWRRVRGNALYQDADHLNNNASNNDEIEGE